MRQRRIDSHAVERRGERSITALGPSTRALPDSALRHEAAAAFDSAQSAAGNRAHPNWLHWRVYLGRALVAPKFLRSGPH